MDRPVFFADKCFLRKQLGLIWLHEKVRKLYVLLNCFSRSESENFIAVGLP